MTALPEWTINVVKGDDLRKLVACEVPRSEVQNCLNFIREYASSEVIGEQELYGLISAFCGDDDQAS